MNKMTCEKIFNFVQANKLDALYIPSFDEYMSEYVPRWNNLRYLSTGFTGSTGDALATRDKIYLFVDGRYHLQADQEIKIKEIEVVKLTKKRIFLAVFDKAREVGAQNLGVILNRVPLKFKEQCFKDFNIQSIDEHEYKELVNFVPSGDFKKVKSVSSSLIGQSVSERLKRLDFENNEAYFLSALDDIAWLTNMRGYHLKHQSSFLAKSIVIKDKVILLCEKG